jgi:hypothetical protein
MTIETLIIPGVDLKLLEEQRHTLGYIKNNSQLFQELGSGRYGHIKGLSNMLDEWSDQIYHKEKLNES